MVFSIGDKETAKGLYRKALTELLCLGKFQTFLYSYGFSASMFIIERNTNITVSSSS